MSEKVLTQPDDDVQARPTRPARRIRRLSFRDYGIFFPFVAVVLALSLASDVFLTC